MVSEGIRTICKKNQWHYFSLWYSGEGTAEKTFSTYIKSYDLFTHFFFSITHSKAKMWFEIAMTS